jgi:hypothetical protein
VVEDRRRACLAAEAIDEPAVVRVLRMQHLDRDLAAEYRIVGAIDLAHPACRDTSDDAIPTGDGGLDHCHGIILRHSAATRTGGCAGRAHPSAGYRRPC